MATKHDNLKQIQSLNLYLKHKLLNLGRFKTKKERQGVLLKHISISAGPLIPEINVFLKFSLVFRTGLQALYHGYLRPYIMCHGFQVGYFKASL